MYLKSIEIHGFKSFAHKMLFEFHDGITAIVGPNGSGKSNVGDAVRWVLGEQSAKQLRGAKMEDIIFAGTEARKPLGFAYVAITLDNSDHKLPVDYEEVTVARRVFRSGESEYLINGTNCRLRDVQELFLDTGIGKEGYSIIGQGQIERILSGKPEERRELFDEAAGIVKFKKRKLTAEKNLEAEKQNLYRINDILSEIEKQVGPLEKQANTAKEYLKYRDELKVLDVNMFLMEYDRITDDQKALEDKNKIVTHDLNSTKQSFDLAKVEYEKLQAEIETYNEQIEANRNQLSENQVKKEQLEGQIKVLQEQIIAVRQSDSHYKDRKSAIDKDIKGHEESLEGFKAKKDEIDKDIQVMADSIHEVETKLATIQSLITEYNTTIENLNGDIFNVLSENANIKTKMQRYETMLEQDNLKKVSLNQRLLKCKSDEANVVEKVNSYQKALEEINVEITSMNEKNKLMEDQLKEQQAKLAEHNQSFNETQQSYHKEKSRLDYLVNITERYEGYGNSIKRVMEQKEKHPGIHGVVADIIKVNQKYEVAVETALGGSIQNIVTDDESTAKDMIDFLKKNKFGRATFLPLTSMSNKHSFYNEAALKEPGVIGLASSLVTTADTYQTLIEHLLGRIVVVDHIDHAIALARKYKYSMRIVTVEGELLSPGGSMSGGAFRNSSNLLGRRREIEEIQHKTEDLAKTLTRLKDEMQAIQEHRIQAQNELTENKKQVQELYIKQNTLKMNLNQSYVNQQNVLHEYEDIRKEGKEIDAQIIELNENITKLKAELDQNTTASKGHETEIARLNKQIEEKRMEEHSVSEELSESRIELSQREQKNQFNLENIKRIRLEIGKLNDEKHSIDENLSNVDIRIKEKEDQILAVKETITASQNQLSDDEKMIAEITQKRDEVSNKHKEFFTKREELSERISNLDKEVFRLNGQMDKLDEQMNAQVNYMWEQYELTYSSALELKTETEESITSIKHEISVLKQKIRGLGAVNVNAIEDYKALEERYELLKTQRDDLVKAEEVLKGIIAELDAEMRKQFEEKFHEIKVEFDKVFKELFGGGKGTLELVEDDDILEAGIKIIAQPPGKKLQNMMQMSGGEKSLTAICLLFAIQNLKPSPFCLLDEIEAALDDSNVSRYANYLKKLSDHTQFIVITHRRGTMGAADRLYGITMQEKGISTLVSVDLIESQLDK
ncbi:chromosome partition protein smc [Lachnospiraceae bacterium KM106-2]|nr:chromosome partition protein smc [Lachnospiraceae bacterium KM106-2]